MKRVYFFTAGRQKMYHLNMSGRIRIKTADLLNSPGILGEAKMLCDRVCMERDIVVFEPKFDHLVPLVVILSQQTIPYSLEFKPAETVQMIVNES